MQPTSPKAGSHTTVEDRHSADRSNGTKRLDLTMQPPGTGFKKEKDFRLYMLRRRLDTDLDTDLVVPVV